MRLFRTSIFVFVCFLTYLPFADAKDPIVRAVLFWSKDCPHCHEVINNTLPPLQKEFGAKLEVLMIEISEPRNYEFWLKTLETRHVPQSLWGVPMLLIGDKILVGSGQISREVPGLIASYLAAGGIDYPAIAGLSEIGQFVATPTRPATPRPTPTIKACHLCDDEPLVEPTPSSTPSPTIYVTPTRSPSPKPAAPYASPTIIVAVKPTTTPPIHVAYFYQPGCQECDRVQLDLNYLRHFYPQLIVHAFDVKTNAGLAEWLAQRANVPEAKRLVAPAIFIGDHSLVDEELNVQNLRAVIERYVAGGAKEVWLGWETSRAEVESTIINRFQSFGLLTILAAGLIDGLNPCAFATIIFFISYLTFAGRRGREVLAVGSAFALGVFLTYLGVGFGVLKFLANLPFLSAIGRWIYGFTALLCLILAIVSLYDWMQARRGKPEEMRLKLPRMLRRWINQVIRQGMSLRAFVPVAFVTGIVISIIELACTGQVYLPTILFVLGVRELRSRAGLYLVFYNFMFVLPLIVVFLLAYFGTTSEQLRQFITRHSSRIKLATAGLFILLAGWLVVMVIY